MKNLYKRISKRIFFYWLERDLNRNLDLLEKFKLQKHLKNEVDKNIKREKKNNSIDGNTQYLENTSDAVDWICSMVISMYSEYEYIPCERDSLEEEAQFVSELFIKAYKKGKIKEEVDIISYLCIPNKPLPINKDKNEKSINNLLNEKNLEEKINEINHMDFNKRLDKVFETLSKIYDKKYKKRLRPGIKHYALGLWYVTYQCALDVRNFSCEYNINYVDDGEQRCLFNVFNLYIHRILFTGKLLLPIEDRRVIFAAAAIHPAQDDYIDKQEVNDDIINDINMKIEGKDVELKDENVKPIFDLIDVIYDTYNPANHKYLVEIIKNLHYWQIESTKQKRKGCDEEELLNISFMKGGYAFAFYGYIALGRMTMLEFRHFFCMGAIFQIMDDLHDISIDIKDNIETIWTKLIYNNNKADEAINGIIEVQKMFESITGPFDTLKRPVFLRRMELFAVRLDLFKFYLQHNEYFSEYIFDDFKDLLPCDLEDYINQYKKGINNIKTINEFESILISIKNSYVKRFKNGNV